MKLLLRRSPTTTDAMVQTFKEWAAVVAEDVFNAIDEERHPARWAPCWDDFASALWEDWDEMYAGWPERPSFLVFRAAVRRAVCGDWS